MRFVSLALLLSGACVLGFTDLPGCVVACEVLPGEEQAEELAADLESYHLETGYLWIPDWPSLSGYEGWLVYHGPYEDEGQAAQAACDLLWRYPDCYAVFVGPETVRRTAPPTPLNIKDMRELMPPPLSLTWGGEPPPGWRVEDSHPDVGMVEEWEQPTLARSVDFGWEIESWVDPYVGTVEMRAVYKTEPAEDIAELYDSVAGFIKRFGEEAASRIEQGDGWVAVSLDRDPELRESDIELWVYRHSDALEFGWSIRSFYGETPYSRPYIPEEARERPF
ncbi:hypothetical protein KAU45_10085 [bacterium]|nr:hypothetical protein [bacterium]